MTNDSEAFRFFGTNNKPLHDIKVLDLTRLLPGPMCTLHLADMGADVIRIEDPKSGDYARSIPPIQKKNSSFFLSINRNKRSVTIDLTKPEGKKIFLKLSETADVITESFRPGVVARLGIDYETTKKTNPKIIYCSITGYGQTGPYRDKAGHDINYCSYAGILNQSKKHPAIPNFQIADIVGGSLNAAMAILAALVYQKTKGKGQYIDISIMDGTLAHSATALALLNYPDSRFLTGALPCYAVYETADSRFIALGALEFKFWKIFCEAIKRDDLISSHIVFGKEAEKIQEEVAEVFLANTLSYWLKYFKDIDCCVSPVLSLNESVNNEQVIARDMIINKEHPTEGNVIQFRLPVKSSEFNFTIQKPAPLLGEHTESVLCEAGYSTKEIDNFRSNKTI